MTVTNITSDSIEFNPQDIADRRAVLWECGYRPVALYSNDKRPFGNDWTERARQDPPDAVGITPDSFMANTGILSDGLRAVDIDVDDVACAEALDRLAVKMLGQAPMRYREGSPRHTWLYRAAEGAPRKRSVFNKDIGEKVEVLGHGQQFMADGIHPSGERLRWHGLCPRWELVAVTEARVSEFLAAAAKIIRATDADGFAGMGGSIYWPPEALEAVDLYLLARVYDAMPNRGLWDDRVSWIMLAHATAAAFRKDNWRGKRLFVDHAARWNGKLAEGEAERVYDSIGQEHRVGAPYILQCARKLGVEKRLLDDYEMATLMADFPESWLLPPEYNGDPTRHPEWYLIDKIARYATGAMKSTLLNCSLAFEKAPELSRVLRWNEFALAIEVHAPAPWDTDSQPVPRALSEGDLLRAQRWLQEQPKGGIQASKETTLDALRMEALGHSHHPVREFIYSLRWDGVPRLDQWLIQHLGALDTPLNRAQGAKWMIAAVARVMQPGCKMDNTLILEGPQDIGKSTALATLAGRPEWFTDHLPDLHSKDAMVQIQGIWIIEDAEMATAGRSETSMRKRFATTAVDRFRGPYERIAASHPRQCVFAQTVNPSGGYLKDETGNRRSWSVACAAGWDAGRQVDMAALHDVRDQLWAEAAVRYWRGETWWLDTTELRQQAADNVDARFESDPWEGHILKHISDKETVIVEELLTSCLHVQVGEQTKAHQMRVSGVLTHLGWTRKQDGFLTLCADGKSRRLWRWRRPEGTAAEPATADNVVSFARVHGGDLAALVGQ